MTGVPAEEPDRAAGTFAAMQATRAARDWRWWVGRVGRVLIATGVLVLLFAAYQLWGTGIQAALAQDELSSQFDQALEAASSTTVAPAPTTTRPSGPTPSTPATSTPATSTPPTTSPPATAPPAPAEGDGVAKIEIPRIGVDWIVVEGVDVGDLRKGPGHYPGTALPGVRGNVAIAGHRTTYGAPFEDVNELQAGDEIVLTTITGRYVYRVTGSQIVSPSETSVLAPSETAILTLTSCHPKYSARQRIIVSAAFDAAASSPLLEPSAGAPPTTVAPAPTTPASTVPGEVTTAPATTVPDSPVIAAEPVETDTFGQGWVSDDRAWLHLAMWGTVLTLIAVGAWLLGKRIPQWAAALIGLVPFTIALYFFFDNVNRLLPPNL
jgi:sortase A